MKKAAIYFLAAWVMLSSIVVNISASSIDVFNLLTDNIVLVQDKETPKKKKLLAKGAPEIVSFRIIPTTVKAEEWCKLYWQVKDAESVRLFEDGRELEGREALPNGQYGWLLSGPASAPMFETRVKKTSTFELVAKNLEGKTTRRKLTVKVAAPQKTNSTISVTIIGTYKKYASEIGVFESVSGERGKFLFKKPVTTVQDHRQGRESTIYRSKFTLAPGKYFIVPKGGGQQGIGNIGNRGIGE